jgi:hypothetical protein
MYPGGTPESSREHPLRSVRRRPDPSRASAATVDGAVSILARYWEGVLQRLEAEVYVFAQLVAHEGERGRENEVVIARTSMRSSRSASASERNC